MSNNRWDDWLRAQKWWALFKQIGHPAWETPEEIYHVLARRRST